MTRTLDLFGPKPRRARQHLMHYVDVGADHCFDDEFLVYSHMVCARCGHDAGWDFHGNATRTKRGIPCPICNAAPCDGASGANNGN